MAKSKAKKAKIKILFNAEWMAFGMDKFGGRKASVLFKEMVKGLTLSGVKDWLKQKLDVAILPGGEAYSPTDEPPKDSIAAFMAANRQGAAGQSGGVKGRRFSRDEQVRASYRQRLRMTRDWSY